MPATVSLRTNATAGVPDRSGALVDIIVLSDEVALYESIRDAVGDRHPVWRARSAEESVDLLVTGRCGVLLVDLASVTSEPDTLIERVLQQFPGVVVCVAGRREDEPLLAPLISDGLIYRFMHKPLSPRRAGMFLQAAIRQHCAKRDDLPRPGRLPDNVTPLPSRFEPLKWTFVAIGVALFVMLLSIVFDGRTPTPASVTAVAPASPAPAAAEATAPELANPVLSRARAAYDAGRYESPSGRNALDLYRAVVLAQPDNAEAKAGLGRTIDRILVSARNALAAGDPGEAQRLVDRVLAADPGRRPAVLLAQQLHKMAERPAERAAPPATSVVPAPAIVVAAPAPVIAATPVSPSPALRGPVTRLPPIDAPARAPTPVAIPAPVVVRPDPLAARVANAPANATRLPPRQPIYARKVEPLPIAGFAKSGEPPSVAAAASATESAPELPAPAGPAQSADSFERLLVTDPVYPPEALRNRVQGWVQLEFTIAPNGSVRDVAVIEAEPQGVFDRAASDALAQWRFRPRYVNGRPVAQHSTVTLRFELDS